LVVRSTVTDAGTPFEELFLGEFQQRGIGEQVHGGSRHGMDHAQ